MKRIAIILGTLCSIIVFSQESKKNILDRIFKFPYKNEYKTDSTAGVAKFPLKDKEIPQVFNTLSERFIIDQRAIRSQTLFQNSTGVARLWQSTGRPGDGAEFYTIRGFAVQPRLVNGMPYMNNVNIDPSNIEGVEILKGPSAMLFGSNVSSFGGLMSISTKKPFETFKGEIGAMMGSNQLNRYTVDVNSPVNKKVQARLITVYHNENTFQDAGFNRHFLIAPSVKVKANDRLSVLVNAEFTNNTAANAPMFFLDRTSALSFSSLDLFEKNYNKSFTNNTLTVRNPAFSLQSQAVYKVNSNWNSQTLISTSFVKTYGYYQYLTDLADGNRFTRMISKANGNTNAISLQQNFLGDFVFKSFRNRVVLGLDYFTNRVSNKGTAWVSNGIVSLSNGTDTGNLSPEDTDRLLQGVAQNSSSARVNNLGLYARDVIYFLPNLSATLGFRLDHFNGVPLNGIDKEKSQLAFSPNIGVVYTPIKDKVTVFANYMNGFNNMGPARVSNADGSSPSLKTFTPEKANQFEIGSRASFYQDMLSVTASFYYIRVFDRIMTDPSNLNNRIQGGQVSSKGLELTVLATPLPRLSLLAGYSHNDAEVIKDTAVSGFLGRRPEEAGPQNLFNFWGHYTLDSGKWKGLSLGLGGNYAGEHKTLNRGNTGTFTLPSYFVFNSVISYTVNKYMLTLRIDNLTNQKYFTGWTTISPQNTRALALGFNLKF